MDSFQTPYGLSNSGKDKLQFTPFWGGHKPGCSDSVRARIIKSHSFFVLGPILVKFHIRTRLIENFRTIFRTWWCGEEKLHFTPVHTLHQLKHDEALIPPLPRVVGFRAKVTLQQFFFKIFLPHFNQYIYIYIQVLHTITHSVGILNRVFTLIGFPKQGFMQTRQGIYMQQLKRQNWPML